MGLMVLAPTLALNPTMMNAKLMGSFDMRFSGRMTTPLLVIFFLTSLLTIAPFARADIDPLDLPLPRVGNVSGIQTAWVAPRMVQNGMPMSIQAFKSSRTIDEVLKKYKQWLSNNGAARAAIFNSEGMNTLGAAMGPFFISIQGKNKTSYGSAGFIVVSLAPGSINPKIDTTLPLPDSAEIISVQRYDDAGKRAESLTFMSTKAVTTVADTLRGNLEDDDWTRLPDYEKANTPESRLLAFQRGSEQLQAVLQRNDRQMPANTLVFITWIKGQ